MSKEPEGPIEGEWLEGEYGRFYWPVGANENGVRIDELDDESAETFARMMEAFCEKMLAKWRPRLAWVNPMPVERSAPRGHLRSVD